MQWKIYTQYIFLQHYVTMIYFIWKTNKTRISLTGDAISRSLITHKNLPIKWKCDKITKKKTASSTHHMNELLHFLYTVFFRIFSLDFLTVFLLFYFAPHPRFSLALQTMWSACCSCACNTKLAMICDCDFNWISSDKHTWTHTLIISKMKSLR